MLKSKAAANIKYKDEIGKTYGRLTILGFSNESGSLRNLKCICSCVCGKTSYPTLSNLRLGKSRSCTCLRDDKIKKVNLKHGLRHDPIYSVWTDMKTRCYNPNYRCYKDYGGRGIIVCQEWLDDFLNFYTWAVEKGYKKGLELDRHPDQNGNYEPGNCRWATKLKQANNKRNNIIVEFKGETMTLPEAVRRYAVVSYHTVHSRMHKYGWDIEKALLTPAK